MELKIDGVAGDLPIGTITIPSYEGDSLADPTLAREGRTLQLVLPPSVTNARLFGRPCDLETATRFNATTHRAVLTEQGATLFEGVIRLLASDEEGFTVDLREGGAAWATRAALQPIEALGIDYEVRLEPTAIRAGWRDDSPVKFFPIRRDSYKEQSNSTDLLTGQQVLSIDDYHPFLHIETLVRQSFVEAGYTIDSRFFESDFFRSLYMSGAYASRNSESVADHIGFLAGRLTTATAVADALGRVYTNPYSAAHSVGNPVETATPYQTDETGAVRYELYNNGNCFGQDSDGAICYCPTTTVRVGFDYRIRYTTQHRIATRTRLTGFDGIYLGSNSELRFELLNRYTDRREALSNNHRYRLIVFDHQAGAQYRLRYAIDGTDTEWATCSERSAEVVSAASGTIGQPALDYLIDGGWYPYEGDWALYDGYIEEVGETTVELRIRTAPEELAAHTVKRFDTCYFFGAEEGMQLTLHRATTLTPHFGAGAGYGSVLRFADVAQVGIRQIELLQALAHLFNLRFCTDETTRTVRIEPEEAFYAHGAEVDWQSKVDLAEPIRILEQTPFLHETRTWCYLEGDGAVTRREAEEGVPFGSCTIPTASAAALLGDKVLRNPLFAPSLTAASGQGSAPSALLLQVGDRDDVADETTNFTPRIVSFLGMHSLPDGERWGFLNDELHYPMVAFHFAGDEEFAATSLCFEDRDGVTGLHRFYDHQIANETEGGSVELTLHLKPWEYEALWMLDSEMADRTSTFRLRNREGSFIGHLYRIGAYDPQSGRLCCTFNRCL